MAKKSAKSAPSFSLRGFRSPVNALYYIHVQSGNNAIVFSSEGYTEKRGAERLLKSLQDDGHFVGQSIDWDFSEAANKTHKKRGLVMSE